MKTEAEFREYYERTLLPELKPLESRRYRIMAGVIVSTIIGLALMVGAPLTVILLQTYLQADNPLICCCLGGVPFIIGVAILGSAYPAMTKAYRRDFKENIIKRIIKCIDENLDFDPSRSISRETYDRSKIFLTHVDRFGGHDLVFGTIGKTKMEFSEVHTEYKTETRDSHGHRHTQWHTIFRGLFIVADFNKNFKGATTVLPDTAEKLFGTMIGSFLQSHNIGRPDLVKLEDPEFEKLFVVYGTDQVEARYILSSSLMQKIIEFKKKTGKRIHLSFVNNNVVVAISYDKDLFEPRVFRTIVDYKLTQSYYEDLQLATSLVDELGLNTRIWGKQ
jgi:hypothetical protein